MAARKMIVPQPTSFQMTWEVIGVANVSGLVIRLTGLPVIWASKSLTTPVPPKSACQMETTMTHPMKCGR